MMQQRPSARPYSKQFNIKTYIENDANTLTLAHQWFGEGRGVNNFIVITIEHASGWA
jgi:predicted NBD/HSP70 family sugar kinase